MTDRDAEQRQAMDALYRETGFLVYRRCLGMLNNEQEAMDVTHWTYIRAIETGLVVQSIPQTLTWLYRTASFRCLALLRDTGNRRKLVARFAGDLRPAQLYSPEQQVMEHDILVQALRQVSERCGRVAILTHFQGLSVERSAEMLEVSVRTVWRERSDFQGVFDRLRGLGDS